MTPGDLPHPDVDLRRPDCREMWVVEECFLWGKFKIPKWEPLSWTGNCSPGTAASCADEHKRKFAGKREINVRVVRYVPATEPA